MAPWRYPDYLPKPPHLMTDADWAAYQQGLSKQQQSDRYSGITSDLIPTFEMIQAQGAGEIDPDPYKQGNSRGPGSADQFTPDPWSSNKGIVRNAMVEPQTMNLDRVNSYGIPNPMDKAREKYELAKQKYEDAKSAIKAGEEIVKIGEGAVKVGKGAVEATSKVANVAGNTFETGVMKAGEYLRHDLIFFLKKFDNKIESSASAYGIDPGIVKAIIYEEQSHLMPFEMTLENEFGIGKTIGAGQVTEGMYGRSREELTDPSINIDVVARHLSQLQDEGLIDPTRPVASLGSRYNNGLTKEITSYGVRVEGFYSRYFAS